MVEDDRPSVEARVEMALSAIRPYLQVDGGDVGVVRIKPEGVLELRWVGTCKNCPMSVMTLRAGVERVIMKEVPEIKRVEAVVVP